ncbi:phage portal protein [Nocardia huaxiensis]|uniref:Phage portal protein n=1 Tax=Nocardia huaxiensis TaxID=2755382 RepID=A0A7D6V710_9NOCA|nr:phage portal protein [Nocardia huaxiensis]QLY27971.1 phage portal protein [Nocardia huaxiensis]
MDNLIIDLMQRLDEPSGWYAELNRYYEGEQALSFLSPEAKAALGNRFGRINSNIPRLAVESLAERLRVTGFSGADVWPDWIRNDLDQTSHMVHREALLLGQSFVSVWAKDGRPTVSVESASQVAVQTDPGTRQVTAAVKRWTTRTTTEATLYLPDRIVHLRANQTGATTQGYKVVGETPNPMGVVPVVPFMNTDRQLILGTDGRALVGGGRSEIKDLMPLCDALNKTLADMLVTSEYTGRPRRWATGLELEEDEDGNAVNPIPEGNRAMISEDDKTKFGQLEPGAIDGYKTSTQVILGQIMAVSALPEHMIGVFSNNPASADAMRAAESSLTARAEARQATFGRSWEQVARLMVAARDGVAPERVEARVQWADPATRSEAQQADALTKLVVAKVLPPSYALKKMGYDDAEIIEIRQAWRMEALDGAGVDLKALVVAE